MTVALYQKGKEFVWEGLELAMKVVAEAEVEAHKLKGWVLHPYDTIEVPKQETEPEPPEAPPASPVPVDPPPQLEQTPTEPPAAPAPVANPFA